MPASQNLIATKYNVVQCSIVICRHPLHISAALALVALFLCHESNASFGSFDEAYAAGKSKFESQDYTAAQDAFKAALELAPDSDSRAQAREGLADCLLEFQDYDGCRTLAEQTLEDTASQPEWPQANALRQIAESYRREKKFDDIKTTFKRADNWEPGLVEWLRLAEGQMWFREQMWEECDKAHRDVLASGIPGNRGWALYWLARTASETGRQQEALEYLKQFDELDLEDVHLRGLTRDLREKLGSTGS